MPKRITKELNELVKIIADHPEGLAPKAILEHLDKPLAERTLRSRLSRLTEQRRLSRTGSGPSTLYFIRPAAESAVRSSQSIAESEVIISLSTTSLEIRKALSRPIGRRKPVGYNRAFLDDYTPNSTHYLSSQVREQLRESGSVIDQDEPAGTYLNRIYDRLLIDLSWNSSRLEGNTYSLLETQRLLDLGVAAEGKDVEESQMILNHKAALELLCEQASAIALDRYTICNLHAVLSENLLTDPQACGRLRSRGVGITGTVFHPLEVPQMIEECFDIILHKASAIDDPFEQAFFVMVQLPYLQPFEDVNKRVSRLAANIPLVCLNLCPLSFVNVPKADYTKGMLGVYELNSVEYLRDVFVWAYQRSCGRYSAVRQSLGKPDPFRLKHRELIKRITHHVVKECLSKEQAVAFIRKSIPGTLPAGDHARLLEIVETELSSLQEGNIARYRLRLSDYQSWQETW